MNENMDAAYSAGGTILPRGCGRAEEFVTYLYGESTPEESRVFRRHLEACDVCREELASFGGVREAVGDWRAEALGSIPPLNISEALAPDAESRRPQPPKRSAVAAFREFFSLAPWWLRAGAVTAALFVCALAALTLARAEVRWDSGGLAFRSGVTQTVVIEHATPPPQEGYTEEQVAAIVARRVEEATAQFKEVQQQDKVVVVSDGGKSHARAVVSNVRRRKRATQPEARPDEALLAEDDLPRLSDLLGGSY